MRTEIAVRRSRTATRPILRIVAVALCALVVPPTAAIADPVLTFTVNGAGFVQPFQVGTHSVTFTLTNTAALPAPNNGQNDALILSASVTFTPINGDRDDQVTQVGFPVPSPPFQAILTAGSANNSITFTQSFNVPSEPSGEVDVDTGEVDITITVGYENGNTFNPDPTKFLRTPPSPPAKVVVIDFVAPEMDPGRLAGALTLLIGGVLAVSDRCRRG
jgi:hypothetical protein